MDNPFASTRPLSLDLAASELWLDLTKEGSHQKEAIVGQLVARQLAKRRSPAAASVPAVKEAEVSSRVLAALAGVAVGGTAGGLMLYNSSRQRLGGKSRNELEMESRIATRDAKRVNEGISVTGPLARLSDTLHSKSLGMAQFFREKPLAGAGVGAGIGALGLGIAGARLGPQLATAIGHLR